MSVDILGTSWDHCRSIVQYSFTSTETRRLVRTDSPGRPPRLTQLLNCECTFNEYTFSQCTFNTVHFGKKSFHVLGGWGGRLNDFQFSTAIGRLPSDGVASIAMKRLTSFKFSVSGGQTFRNQTKAQRKSGGGGGGGGGVTGVKWWSGGAKEEGAVDGRAGRAMWGWGGGG